MKAPAKAATIGFSSLVVYFFAMPQIIMLAGEKSAYQAGARSVMPTLIFTAATTFVAYKTFKRRELSSERIDEEGKNESAPQSKNG